jgi:hypothetical protein
MDKNPKKRSPKNLQSQTEFRKLSEIEMFSYSHWLMTDCGFY